jgi:hypothetical protein
MVQPLALHEMNYFELCDKLRLPDEEFEGWMKALGLIDSSMTCDRCQEPMRDAKQGRDRYWIYEKRECRFGPTNQNKPMKGFFAVCFLF